MDYSQLSNDADHPAGSSPWQSSPHPTNRTGYAFNTGNSQASSPVATSTQNGGQSGRTSHEYASEGDTLVQDDGEYTESEGPTENRGSPDLSTRLQSPPLTEQGFDDSHYHQPYQVSQQRQPSYQQQQKPSIQARHPSSNRPRQNVPQYKLQAKITGLERTGRKDPILRFDVHVGLIALTMAIKAYSYNPRQTCLSSGLHSFGTSDGHTRSFRNLLII